MTKKCSECKWLVRYESKEHASYMDVCTVWHSQEELGEEGMYHVVVIDLNEFDASDCLNYRPK